MDGRVIDKPLFYNNSAFTVAGASRSGKTEFVSKLLHNMDVMFYNGRPDRVLYCYSRIQDKYLELERDIKRLTLHEGLPSLEYITNLSQPNSELLIVLDDLIFDVVNSKEIATLFTSGRHFNTSVIFITQNLLEKGTHSRTISINSCYIILFRNIRDSNQVVRFASQIYPRQTKEFMQVYRDVMKKPFRYLVLDTHPFSANDYRIRTKVFPEEVMRVYELEDME